jgi:hypothetical protein
MKIDDAARPQPRSKTRMPGRKSNAFVSHSVNHSEFAPPLTLANIHSGLYCEDRGKLVEMNRVSKVIFRSQFLHDAFRPGRLCVPTVPSERLSAIPVRPFPAAAIDSVY